MKSVAIIGFGRFGQMTAAALGPHFDVCAYDLCDKRGVAERLEVRYEKSIDKAARCDVVILSMPISELEPVLHEIAPHLRKGALVLDVCSVKKMPAELMEKILPEGVDIIATHPLFGPVSPAEKDRAVVAGSKVVLCPVRTVSSIVDAVRRFLEKLGLVVYVTTPDEHDRQMAVVQGLTHYIALALMRMGVSRRELSTPNFDELVGVAERLRADSDTLLFDIQRSNSYAATERQRFRDVLDQVERDITNG